MRTMFCSHNNENEAKNNNRASFFKAVIVDEPSGKLRAVKIICETNGQKTPIVLEFEYNSSLFSAERNWSIDLIKKQKVVKVYLPGESFYNQV
jgi:hypothetical protein